ncbi:DNA polymerase theta [Schistosoma bovis]|uniref:DNA-directed DNA polymerase n=1 Tax=Schistosoma bovis TaxID=6184 RepID=A0A430QQM6_SCHBO|nr:DNA polymerase theta [Schistosoma bovis]
MEIKVGSPIRIEDAFYVPEELYRQYKEMNISSIFSWQAECLNLPGVLGIVVVDELHLIGDTHRGYLLELLLTKLLFYSRRISNFKHTNEIKILENSQSSLNKCCDSKAYGIQIVGMSATLPNLKSLGQWLNAEVYITNFRPVPLTEFILSCDLRSKKNQFYKIVKSASKDDSSTQQLLSECLEPADNLPLDPQLTSDTELNMIDEDGVFALCFDTLLNGHGVLVFCPTKQWCEQLADTMARQIFILTQSYFSASHQNNHNQSDANIGNSTYKNSDDHSVQSNIGTRLALQLDRVGLVTCVEQLKRCPAGLDTILARCLGYGVAFHHAGLTVEEREIIEFGFRKGLIRILIATSTLSSGVNLPARRVIIRTPLFHGKVLDFLTYKQMSGRAGRQGVDTSETLADALLYLSSTLLATTVTWEKLNEFNNSQSPSTKKNRRRSLRLSQPKTYSENEINGDDDNENNNNNRFTVQMKRLLFTCIKDLQKHEFIYIDQSTCLNLSKNVINTSFTDSQSLELSLNGARLQPTALGRAVLSSSLGPVHGLIVYEELDRARRSIALDTELHLVYLLTPVYLDVGADLDWLCYLEQYQSLSSSERRVADLIGIEERFITRCAAGAPSSAASCHGNTNVVNRRLNLHRRFYTALVLYRLVNEDGLQIVAKKFGVNRGLLQSLQQQSATYAGMVTIFCNRLGWNHMERVIANFQSRLCYGVSDELVDLIRLLPLVNAERARALYAGGYSSVSSLASARPQEISRIIQRAIPFERKNNHEVCVVKPSGGCTILLDDGRVINEHEAGPLIVQQAKLLLEIDLTSVYGKDLIIIPKNHESESSMKPVKSIIENVNDCDNMNKNDIVDSQNNQLMTPNLSYNSLHDLNLTRGCKYFMDRDKNQEHLNVKVEEVEVKRLKLSLDSDTTIQTSSMSAARTSPLINSDDHKNPNVDHEFCSVNKENYSSDNNKTDYENSISITSNSHIPVSKFDSSVNRHDKTVIDFENFTQSSQPFILTSQLAAIIDDDQVVLTNKLPSSTETSTSRFNVKSNLLHSPISCESSSIPFSATTTPSSLSVSNKTCEFNDTLTYSMFESSFAVSNNTSITTIINNNDNINGPICDIMTTETLKEQYDDSQTLNNLMMSQINFDTDIGKKQELSISHQQSQSNLSKASINPNESFLNMERKSIGDLFSASFTHDSPTNEVQLKQESSDDQHMYSSKTAECKTDTDPPSADDILIADSLENGVDNDNDRDNIFSVINVTQNYTLWKTFLTELNDHIEGLKSSNQSQLNYIAIQPGWLLNTNSDSNNDNDFRSSSESLCWKSGPAGQPTVGGGKNMCTNYDLYLSGLAISSVLLMKNAVFWIHFLTESDVNRVPLQECLIDIYNLFIRIHQFNIGLIIWDVKWWYRIAYDILKIPNQMKFHIYNPNLTNWLTNPDQDQSSLLSEAQKLNPHVVDSILTKVASSEYLEPPIQFSDWSKIPRLESSGKCPPPRSYLSEQNLLSNLPYHVYITSAQCFLLSLWTTHSNNCLSTVQNSLLNVIELPCQSLLARMESNGFLLNLNDLNKCHDSLLKACKQLESVAYRLAGQPFTMDSPKEISKVLFKWLHLPQITDPNDLIMNRKRNQSYLLNGRNRSSHLPKATNTLLSKLTNLHPLPAVIMEWRHINGILEKIFNSLVSTCRLIRASSIGDQPLRISPTYDVYTATGRIISIMPNLQSVPKDIIIDWSKLHYKSTTVDNNNLNNNSEKWTSPFDQILSELPKSIETIKPRCAFHAPVGGLLISGDFCQLELRLLAYFSKDVELLKLLSVVEHSSQIVDQSIEPNSESDAFKKLAAHWLNIPHPNQVTDVQRQQAKQLCYAILYGMGCQTLASQLNISQQNAQKLIDSFLNTYPGVQKFITTTVLTAHREGQIQTLNGHIRLLPALNSKTVFDSDTPYELNCNWSKKHDVRNHFAVIKAERQAVNNIIQGSASEIAKIAMLAVDQAIHSSNIPGYAHLVLHEHDELIYELYLGYR